MNWIISVRNIPYAKSLWVVVNVVVDVVVSVVGINLELEKETGWSSRKVIECNIMNGGGG